MSTEMTFTWENRAEHAGTCGHCRHVPDVIDTFTCEDCGHTYRDDAMTPWKCEHDPGDIFCEHCLPDHVVDCEPCVDRVSRAAEYDYRESLWKERNL